MWLLGTWNKVDSYIKPYLHINSKRKIPVIVCYKDDVKVVKNKILNNSGRIKYEYTYVKAFACDLPPLSIDKLSENPEISYICFDYKAKLCLRKTNDIIGIGNARLFNLTGKNIGIGIIDSGVYPHDDLTSLRNSVPYFKDLINNHERPYDDNGHGTFLCGCIASSGHSSSGMYVGIAPDSNLCVVKAFDAGGYGFMSDIIKGIDELLNIKGRYNLRVLCLPFEFPYLNNLRINPLKEIIKKTISIGISVVAPSGNLGPQPYSVYFPGNMQDVVTVGGVSCLNKDIKSYFCPAFSGRGPTIEGYNKPDIVLPCVNIISLASDTSFNPNNKKKSSLSNPYTTMSGTSISCALIAGACALILEKTPELTPQDLKSVLCLSTMSIGENKFSQGNGLFIFDKIVK
ncbi:hypothetical protein Q428_13440 [Fervidicella metallireducens AeB]|uniref:Peptidase S8/S53 domain-containing protein n=1 Tax=Fervidicella metallireducens AeB TaxID=1403537 RepID=A0A017RU47_9CLOT|nr:S8 family serine peptidase [Fervidicella metallireducens]EYE87420.1 hypothetical protein Q428_13440 [Fervidicella metallireducens AeB]